jgi:very-short-patch-repair endonuclease
MDKVKCSFCGKEYSKKGIGTHIWRNHGKGINHNPNKGYKNERISWNKGLTKEINESIKQRSEKIKGRKSPFKGKHHSQETKNKISQIRINYLLKHPEKVPYLYNHSSKISYPEELLLNKLKDLNIDGWEFKFRNSIYQYDFAWPELKIDVEIDGGTHQSEKVKKIDERRDKFSRDNGWLVLRFSANDIKYNIDNCIKKILNNIIL